MNVQTPLSTIVSVSLRRCPSLGSLLRLVGAESQDGGVAGWGVFHPIKQEAPLTGLASTTVDCHNKCRPHLAATTRPYSPRSERQR